MKSEISQELAEIFGMHAGDGSLYKTSWGHVWELRGGKDEKEFYDGHVVPLLKRIYDYPFKGRERSGGKNGCYGVRCCRKGFIGLFLDAGFTSGTKVYSIQIPAAILDARDEMAAAFLRGLFATDGTLYLARVNRKAMADYPMIEFSSASRLLRDQTVGLLHHLGIDAYTGTYKPKKRGGPCHFLRLAGREKTALFAEKVRFANLKHRRIFKQYISFKNGSRVSPEAHYAVVA